jgi:hypothetical protein
MYLTASVAGCGGANHSRRERICSAQGRNNGMCTGLSPHPYMCPLCVHVCVYVCMCLCMLTMVYVARRMWISRNVYAHIHTHTHQPQNHSSLTSTHLRPHIYVCKLWSNVARRMWISCNNLHVYMHAAISRCMYV